jgi:RNA polymerase sigma-B factor
MTRSASGDGREASRRRSTSATERAALIEGHLGLARHLVRLFEHRGEAVEDLMQVASMALVLAADRFDPALDYEFSTFATPTIIGELKRHFRDRAWAVKTPRTLKDLYREVSTVAEELSQSLGRPPSVQEVARACGRRDDEVLSALEAGQGYRTTSLDAESSREPPSTGHDDLAAFADRDELLSHLAQLPQREQEIIRLRFVDEMSQEDIAARVGLSQVHVSRLLTRAIRNLRALYRLDPPQE